MSLLRPTDGFESKYLDQGCGSMSLVRPDLELRVYV